MVRFEFGQDRLAEPHPLNTFELLRVRSKAPSSYFQRPCSGSLVRFAKSLFFAAMRPQPFRQHLLDPPAGWLGGRVVPPCFPSCPEGRTLATYLPLPYTTFAESLFLPEPGSRDLQPTGYGSIAKGSTLKRVRSASMVKIAPASKLFLCPLKCVNDLSSNYVRVKVLIANLNHTGLL